jgi:hypothetical protein
VSDPFDARHRPPRRHRLPAAHPNTGQLNGAPQMVELSRDGQRLYFSTFLLI